KNIFFCVHPLSQAIFASGCAFWGDALFLQSAITATNGFLNNKKTIRECIMLAKSIFRAASVTNCFSTMPQREITYMREAFCMHQKVTKDSIEWVIFKSKI